MGSECTELCIGTWGASAMYVIAVHGVFTPATLT